MISRDPPPVDTYQFQFPPRDFQSSPGSGRSLMGGCARYERQTGPSGRSALRGTNPAIHPSAPSFHPMRLLPRVGNLGRLSAGNAPASCSRPTFLSLSRKLSHHVRQDLGQAAETVCRHLPLLSSPALWTKGRPKNWKRTPET